MTNPRHNGALPPAVGTEEAPPAPSWPGPRCLMENKQLLSEHGWLVVPITPLLPQTAPGSVLSPPGPMKHPLSPHAVLFITVDPNDFYI